MASTCVFELRRQGHASSKRTQVQTAPPTHPNFYCTSAPPVCMADPATITVLVLLAGAATEYILWVSLLACHPESTTILPRCTAPLQLLHWLVARCRRTPGAL